MHITVASDLHAEQNRSLDWLKDLSGSEVVVLAGDIGVGRGALEVVFKVAEACPNSSVVWVAGNHEFYRQNIDSQIAEFRSACDSSARIFFLENDAIDIGGVRFVGCTLWSGFDAIESCSPQEAMSLAQNFISDFYLIRCGSENRKFTPEDAATKHVESVRFLRSQLNQKDGKRTVVVTHFPPSLLARNKNFEADGITAYFQANLDQMIHEMGPDLWVYGHNHYSDDMTIGRTRVVSNQLGYRSEQGSIPHFSTRLQILV